MSIRSTRVNMGDPVTTTQIGGAVEEQLKKWMQQLEQIHPVFRAGEALAVMVILITIMVLVAEIWPGGDLAFGVWLVGVPCVTITFATEILPLISDFDSEPLGQAIDKFGNWSWSWGILIVALIVSAMAVYVIIESVR